MKNIFLIRHGESEANAGISKQEGNYTIDPIIKLTEKGMNEAIETGDFLYDYINKNNINIDKSVLWVSPYTRTRDTAKYINQKIGIKNVYEDPRIVEQDFGNFDSFPLNEWERLDPLSKMVNNKRYNDPLGRFFARFPNGESPLDMYTRISTFIDSLYRHDDDNVFIVFHGIAIRVFLMRFFHYPVEWLYHEENPQNCSIRLITFEDGKLVDKGYIKN